MRPRRTTVRHPRKKEPVVWIIDSEQWPRACLRAELIERGYDAYGFITIQDALEWFTQPSSPAADSIILELRGQKLTKQLLEAIQNLNVPIIVLGGSTELNESLIKERKWDEVLKRPISLGKVADVVQKRLTRKATIETERTSHGF
jgi:DNA-binding response OmpR family regulator